MPETTAPITFEEARARIEAVAVERPDYVNAVPAIDEETDEVIPGNFKDCIYFNADGSPSCIVGTAFADELRAAGVTPTSSKNDEGVWGLIKDRILHVTEKAQRYLELVQESQDTGTPWADAAAYASELTEAGDLDDVDAVISPRYF